MSKARLVITAVVVEGRGQSDVARDYGVSQSRISRLVARYRVEGEAAFTPHCRRPHTSPTRLNQTTIDSDRRDTHWWLADRTHVEILDWLDDHSRYTTSVTAIPGSPAPSS